MLYFFFPPMSKDPAASICLYMEIPSYQVPSLWIGAVLSLTCAYLWHNVETTLVCSILNEVLLMFYIESAGLIYFYTLLYIVVIVIIA